MAEADDDAVTTGNEETHRSGTGGGGGMDASAPAFSAAARYELGDVLGKGGMGEVLNAADKQIKREVALKRIRGDRSTARGMARFFHEALIQGRLDHPAILPVHELGIDPQGRPFFVMKKLAGTTLSEAIGKAPRERLLRAFVDVCNAIAFAHKKGIVHRDLKPANIGLGDYGEVYVLDWGIARVLDETDEPDLVGSASDEDHTAAGSTVGTVGYMAPEQMGAAATADTRADVYALGCILFEILANERLQPRGITLEAAQLAKLDARPSTRGVPVPPELEALCVDATAFDRDARIQSAKLLGDRVQAFLDGDRDIGKRRELARKHLDAAQRAFIERASEAGRSTAMREAGRALALDPELDAAADLVTRLMLEPPVAMPPEVAAVVAQEDDDAISRNARLGRYAYLACAAFIPLLLTSGKYAWAITLAIAIALNITCVTIWRAFGERRRLLVAVANCALISVVAVMYSPFFIAPGFAAIATMVIVHSPDYDQRSRAIALGVGMATAILVPFALEATGIIPRTMDMTPQYVSFAGPAVGMPHMLGVLALVMYLLALLGSAVWIGHAVRVAERTARTHLHLQAWQLAQLVPATRPAG